MKIGIITGTGLYELTNMKQTGVHSVKTSFGNVDAAGFKHDDHTLYHIARHGANHKNLPNMINHRANISALNNLGVELIIGTSVMGIIDPDLPLAKLMLFNDLYYPDNRLPSGEMCTIYTGPADAKRGHYIFDTPFSKNANRIAAQSAESLGVPYTDGLTYAFSCGPRFNSKAEIRSMRNAGSSCVSQTAGPEIVLAGELEIGYLLLGFAVDYANGVKEVPTPVEVLNENLGKSRDVFARVIEAVLSRVKSGPFFDSGFVYRFN